MIIRAIALKNATVTGTACACSGAGAGPIADLGGRACDVDVRAFVQYLSSGANGHKVFLQANSSSGYSALNTGVDIAAFSSRACRDGVWASITWNCASATSTHRSFYRAAYSQTCTDTNLWLAAMSVGGS